MNSEGRKASTTKKRQKNIRGGKRTKINWIHHPTDSSKYGTTRTRTGGRQMKNEVKKKRENVVVEKRRR